jgi:hypothetical protein
MIGEKSGWGHGEWIMINIPEGFEGSEVQR